MGLQQLHGSFLYDPPDSIRLPRSMPEKHQTIFDTGIRQDTNRWFKM